MTLQDAEQRQQAIDPTQSYIVQAPAGSGKTELLTQRFLRLLGLVNAPEQIIALTFTKKAANEMRERILHALQLAAANTPATTAHQQQTLNYATQALARDKALDWQLLAQPSRLRIITIDALCQRLSHAIPLQDEQISFPGISATPDRHYRAAAKACLNFAIEHQNFQPAIRTLLLHVDNQQDTLLALFVDLLNKRDQWLNPLYHAKMQDKSIIEDAIAFIEQHELSRFQNSIPHTLWHELIDLAARVARIENDSASKRYLLSDWSSVDHINAELTASLAALLLTTQQTLRKSFDHHVGLKKGVCDDAVYYDLKTRSQRLLEALSATPDFLDALLRVNELPEPHYDPEQWDVLQALFTLLPVLVAHLNLVFNENSEVDFSAISQQALDALGDEDNPTDLALYLDNTIQHLLVDEFQDTSIQQYQLLSKLVHGWQLTDGRTLFVVGDPMQSIYRFRAAEVGLFLRAKTEGIGGVKLTPLQLCCNFRSTETVVEWVNQQFQSIFPQTDDIESGAVSFSPSTHMKANHPHTQISAHAFNSRDEEADALINIIKHELETHAEDTIAILVRSRSQLSNILMRLREQNIPFQGVEIDLLTTLPHLRDVWSLTQALLMPANRLAWLAFLRSPWCGVSLADLHQIANANKHQSIYQALSNAGAIASLSAEGRVRCQYIMHILSQALAKRHQQSLVDWIIDTLNALHLEHVLTASAQEDLEQYWLLLEQFEQDGQLSDLDEFYEQLKRLYSKQVTPSRLQIMTIHKSKGLEFDCVILPGLSKKPSPMDKPLLRWLKLPSPQHEDLLLISPVKAAHHVSCRLYDYLGKLDAQKNEYELQRLLYVATTRAKKRLYLTDNQQTPGQASFRSLLHQEFTIVESHIDESETLEPPLPALYRLPLEFYQHQAPAAQTNFTKASFNVNDSTPRLIGIIMHEILQWICEQHVTQMDALPFTLIENRLHQLGLPDAVRREALDTIMKQFAQFFQCPIAQWIINTHDDARNEYELLIEENGDIATRIIDRTFCDNGIRWIIDFKTGRETTDSQQKYHAQLNDYARILSYKYPEPIRCGLYYLANNHWNDWEFVRGLEEVDPSCR